MRLLSKLASGPVQTTVVIVTHDQRLLDHADRIVNMVNGRIVSNVRPKELVRILKVLQQVKELEGLGDMTLTRIAERMTIERRRDGDTVVREGAARGPDLRDQRGHGRGVRRRPGTCAS